MDKVYAKMIKWSNGYVFGKHFIVLWSDYTWQEFSFEHKNKSIESAKAHLCLKQITSRKVEKEEAIRFINCKIMELETEK